LLQEQDFPESNLITADHEGKKRFYVELIAPAWFLNSAGALLSALWSTLEPPPRKWQSGEELLRGSRSKLISGNPAPEKKPGLKRTRIGAI
jgi:hypothetical protein